MIYDTPSGTLIAKWLQYRVEGLPCPLIEIVNV
jgi:hypothetical protein